MAFNLTYEIEGRQFELSKDTLSAYKAYHRCRALGMADLSSAVELAAAYLVMGYFGTRPPMWFPVLWLLGSCVGNWLLCAFRSRTLKDQLKIDDLKSRMTQRGAK